MSSLDKTIDEQVKRLVEQNAPGFDPTKIEFVQEIKPPVGATIQRIGGFKDSVVCLIKDGLRVIGICIATVSAWETFVAALALLTPLDLPSAKEVALILRRGTAVAIEQLSESLLKERKNVYFAAKGEWEWHDPTLNELTDYQPNPFYDDKVTLVSSIPASGSTYQNSAHVSFGSGTADSSSEDV